MDTTSAFTATNIKHLSPGYRGSGKTKYTNKNRLELVSGLKRDSRHWWTVSEESLGMSKNDFSVSFLKGHHWGLSRSMLGWEKCALRNVRSQPCSINHWNRSTGALSGPRCSSRVLGNSVKNIQSLWYYTGNHLSSSTHISCTKPKPK